MPTKFLKLTLAGLLGTVLFAQTKPNFSGEWTLDVLRSRLDPKADVKSANMKIAHSEPKLKIDMNMETGHGGRQYTLDLPTDGTEVAQTVDGKSCKATARWGTRTGERLQIETKCQDGASEIVTSREMKLGSKGKMITTIATVNDQSGKRKSYEFFTKAR